MGECAHLGKKSDSTSKKVGEGGKESRGRCEINLVCADYSVW